MRLFGSRSRRLIVSLHDVAPLFEEQIRAQVRALADLGVGRVVLNVVPNWHAAYPLERSPGFVAYLRSLVGDGCQIVLHGCEHQPHGPLRGSPIRRYRGAVFASDAAELLTGSPADAWSILANGLAQVEASGLPRPDTLCAPGWLISDAALEAASTVGIQTVAGMFYALDVASGQRTFIPSFGYMGASAAQERGIALLNGIVRHSAMVPASVAAAYLHPQGFESSGAARQTLTTIAHLMSQGWQPATYAEVPGHDD